MSGLYQRMAGQYALVCALAGASLAASFLILPGEAERAAMHLRDREYTQALALFEARLAKNGTQVATVAPLARLYAQQGDLNRAIAMLDGLLADAALERADTIETRKLLQIYLRWAGRDAARRTNLVELTRLEPTLAGLRELSALASFAGEDDLQIESLIQLVALPDAELADFVELAQMQAGRRAFAEASATLADLAERFPNTLGPSVLELAIVVALEMPDPARAVALAQARLATAPMPPIVGAIAVAFLGQQRAADALRALAPIESRLGADADVNLALMRVAADAPSLPLVGRLFDQQLARGTAGFQPRHLAQLVEFGFASGRDAQAVALAAALDPDALATSALLQLVAQALDRGQSSLLQAIARRIDPTRLAEEPVLAARMYLAVGDRAQALRAVDRAAAQGVDQAQTPLALDAALALVGILAELDLPARALRILESVANAADLPETAIGDMAQLYLTLKRATDGAATFERLRVQRPNSRAAAIGWALTNAMAGRDRSVAGWLDTNAIALPAQVLNDLFFIGADTKSVILQLAAARRLLAFEGPTLAARLRLAQAALAAGRSGEALAQARALRAEQGTAEIEFLYREALAQTARTDANARTELRGYWRTRLGDVNLPPAAREEALYALIDQRAWDDVLPELARRARRAPDEWLGAYVSAARAAGRQGALVDMLEGLASDASLTRVARAQAAYALLDVAPARSLGALRRMANDFGGEWQDALDIALERANLRDELRASLLRRAQDTALAPAQRRALGFRLLDLSDKAAALALFQSMAEGGPADALDAQQVLFLMGPRPEPAQLDWIEAQARAADGAVRLGWMQVLLNAGVPRRAATLLEADAARPDRTGGAATVAASEAYIALGDRVAAARLLAARIPRESDPSLVQRQGELSQALGRIDLARQAFDRLYLLEPSRPAGQRAAGLQAFADGDSPRARDLLGRYLAGPNQVDWEVHYAFAETLVRLRDRAAAQPHHEAAIATIDRLDAAPVFARAAKAYALYRLAKFDESLELFKQLLREQPRNLDLRADYAGVLIELGRTAEARSVLEGRS
jgi:thioredoxin-like negative regulator of GroEL